MNTETLRLIIDIIIGIIVTYAGWVLRDLRSWMRDLQNKYDEMHKTLNILQGEHNAMVCKK